MSESFRADVELWNGDVLHSLKAWRRSTSLFFVKKILLTGDPNSKHPPPPPRPLLWMNSVSDLEKPTLTNASVGRSVKKPKGCQIMAKDSVIHRRYSRMQRFSLLSRHRHAMTVYYTITTDRMLR